MIEALKKLENKFSHKSWQFRCSKWVFRHLLYDHLSAWQTVAWTLFSSLSHCLCLSLQNWFAHLEVGQLDFWETICSLRAGHSGERPWIRLLTQRRHLALCSLLFLLAVFWDELSFYYWAKWSSFSTEGQNSLSSVPDPVTTRTEYARLKVW